MDLPVLCTIEDDEMSLCLKCRSNNTTDVYTSTQLNSGRQTERTVTVSCEPVRSVVCEELVRLGKTETD